MFGVYIHIPFCSKVCDYCDFHVMPAFEKLFQEYVDLLCLEIEAFGRRRPGLLASAETLYLGGGTPSILPVSCLQQIFASLRKAGVRVESLREVSMEFNPESTSRETLNAAVDLGVRRISLGLQTFDADLLKLIGRSHSVEAGLRALDLLTSTPGVQVSGDLMFDLPTQTVQGFLNDVDRLSGYPLNHVSFYGLTLSPRTLLGQRVQKGLLTVDEDLYEEMYLCGVKLLESKGFGRYEVSNFAKPGFESVHNRNYWDRGEYAGFGPGAHSFEGGRRFYAPEMYPRWRDYVRSGAEPSMLTVDELSKEDMLTEMIWLSLRQAKGLCLKDLAAQGFSLDERCVEKWIGRGYLVREDDRVRLVDRGWIFMDEVVTDFMENCR